MLFLLSTALAVASTFLPTTNALMMACNNTVNGVLYDLNPLHALGDIKVTPLMGAYDYYINVCGAVQGPCASHPGAFSCQVRKSPPDQFEAVQAYSDIDTHTPAPVWGPSAGSAGGVKLTFTNGDSCNLRQRIMNIDFQCDYNGTRAITIDENPQCTYNVIYPTKVVCQAPTTAAPTTEAPTTKAPTTEVPTTAAPTTEAPTTKAPTTEAPTTLAPTTEAPTTAAPTTKAPTTEVPTTAAPTTEAPTHAPTTEAPTTEAPTTAAPTTHAPTSTPTPAGSEMMSCNHTVNGTNYDLSPLHALGDVKVIPQAGAYDYYINVCGAVGGPCASHPSAFACQVRKSPADQFESVVAYTNMTNHTEPVWGPSAGLTGGVQLTFINGDSCNLRQRKMKIDFQCDINGTRAITIDENPQCTFNIIYPTQVVCPGYVPPTTAAPTTAAPTTDAPTYLPTTAAPTTAAPTTHAPTSTPTSASSTYDENTITRAGLGAGIGIGVGCLAIVWLLWCCYDRRRVQQQVQADAYAPLTSSSV